MSNMEYHFNEILLILLLMAWTITANSKWCVVVTAFLVQIWTII